jgi:hypothetical protein
LAPFGGTQYNFAESARATLRRKATVSPRNLDREEAMPSLIFTFGDFALPAVQI